MSHYIYRLFINFLLIHYFIYRLVRWSDPNVVNLASIVHTLIGTARVSDYLHFFCKVYKYWNLHSGIFWPSHKHYNLQYVIYFSFEGLLALPHLLVLAKSFPFSLLQSLFPGYIKEKFF